MSQSKAEYKMGEDALEYYILGRWGRGWMVLAGLYHDGTNAQDDCLSGIGRTFVAIICSGWAIQPAKRLLSRRVEGLLRCTLMQDAYVKYTFPLPSVHVFDFRHTS